MGGGAVDHLNYEIMHGFGAVPKRGAEVGGLLLGTVERGERCVVRIEDSLNIPCEHLHGPSYILSPDDVAILDREMAAYSAESGNRLRVVGFYRSNTRGPMQLAAEDLALLDARLPGAEAVCLLVRPFATRPSEAVFLTRENGHFSGAAQTGVFTLRRKEMHLAPAPRRARGAAPSYVRRAAPQGVPPVEVSHSHDASRPVLEARTGEHLPELRGVRLGRRRYPPEPQPELVAGEPPARTASTVPDTTPLPVAPAAASPEEDPPTAPPEAAAGVDQPPVKRRRWVWAPLCFVFLVLGVLLGVGVTEMMNRAHSAAASGQDPYALGLGVTSFGDSFHLRWNPKAPVLRQARGGELVIEEGGTSKIQPLTVDDLIRGGFVYHGAAAPVRFRLMLFLRDRAAFSESADVPAGAQ